MDEFLACAVVLLSPVVLGSLLAITIHAACLTPAQRVHYTLHWEATVFMHRTVGLARHRVLTHTVAPILSGGLHEQLEAKLGGVDFGG